MTDGTKDPPASAETQVEVASGRLLFAGSGHKSLRSWVRRTAMLLTLCMTFGLFTPSVSGIAQAAFQMRSAALGKPPAKGKWLEYLPKFYWLKPSEPPKADRRIVPMMRYILWRFKQQAGDCFDVTPGRHSYYGEHPLGDGCDVYPNPRAGGTWDDTDKLAEWLHWRRSCTMSGCPNRAFKFIGYDGYPNHGKYNHLHLSFKHSQAKHGTRAAVVWVMKLARGHKKDYLKQHVVKPDPTKPPLVITPQIGSENDPTGKNLAPAAKPPPGVDAVSGSPPQRVLRSFRGIQGVTPSANTYQGPARVEVSPTTANQVLQVLQGIDGVALSANTPEKPGEAKVSQTAARKVLKIVGGVPGVELPAPKPDKTPTAAAQSLLAEQVLTNFLSIPGVVLPAPIPVAPPPPPTVVTSTPKRTDGSDQGASDSSSAPPTGASPVPELAAGVDSQVATPVSPPTAPVKNLVHKLATKKQAKHQSSRLRQDAHGPNYWRQFVPRYAQPIVSVNAKRYDLEPAYLAAMLIIENGFDNDHSTAGARGWAQIMPFNFKRLGIKNPDNPWQSVRGGAKELRRLIDNAGGNHLKALYGYNGGEAYAHNAKGVPAKAETRSYGPKIYAKYKQLGGNYIWEGPGL